MSAPGNVIEDEGNDSAAAMLADAVDTETTDRPVASEDVAALAAELAAARRDRDAERTQRLAAAEQVGRTQTALQTAQEQRYQAVEDAITNGIVAAQSEMDRLTTEAATAFSEGRYNDAATATRQAGVQEMRLEGFKSNKSQLAAERDRIKNAPADPEASLSAATRAWIDQHPRFRTDRVYQNWAMTAHGEATERMGLMPDTPAYFKYVDNRIGQQEAAMNLTDEPVTERRSTQTPAEIANVREPNAATVAAPVTRRAAPAAGGNGGRGTSVTLSAEQRDAANRMFADAFPTEKERLQHYVNMQQKLKESGRIGA